jgi:hypothetical protein
VTRVPLALTRLSALVGAVAMLAGCATAPPTPEPAPAAVAPVLAPDQDKKVLESVRTTLEAAQANNDLELLRARLTGPALDLRWRQLEVAQKRGNADLVTPLPTAAEQVVPPTTTTWPRTMFAVSVVPEGGGPQRLMAFDQASAREQYKLWGWTPLVAGTVLPALGAQVVSPDDATLALAPADLVGQYGDFLSHGGSSQFAALFPEDPFSTWIVSNATTQLDAIKAQGCDGTYTMSFQPADHPPHAMRTLDGGAVVMIAYTAEEVMDGKACGLNPGLETTKALYTGPKDAHVLKTTYRDVVALYVPAAGSTASVRLLGYTHVADAVTNG